MLATLEAYLATSSTNLDMLCKKKAKGIVYHQASRYETWWYTTPFVSQLIRQQVGGFLFDMGFLGPCKSMPRMAKDVAKHA